MANGIGKPHTFMVPITVYADSEEEAYENLSAKLESCGKWHSVAICK